MKWCRFQSGDTAVYGLVEDGKIVEVAGSPFMDSDITTKAFPLEKVKLLELRPFSKTKEISMHQM